MPLILTSAPRVTQGLPTLPSDMEHVLSMKLRLTTKDVNTLWCSLGDRLMKDFISDHLSPANLDVDRELSITGPSFHLGELGVQLGMVPLAYSLIVKILSVDTRCRDTRPSHSTMYYSWMSSITQAIRWKSGIFPRYCIYTPTWSSKDTDSHHILPRCEPKNLECCSTILTLHHSLGCSTSYYPNYYVSHPRAQTATRRYYSGVPQYVEAVKHSYVETKLVKLFRSQMAFTQ